MSSSNTAVEERGDVNSSPSPKTTQQLMKVYMKFRF